MLQSISPAEWERLSRCRIYFGHQSVGYNIIEGVRDIMKQHQEIRLNIVETVHPDDLGPAMLGHGRIGKNQDPSSKIDAFVRLMENGAAEKVDMALFKFCYVDVTESTDIDRLFDDYKNSLASLKARYPNTIFIHVTVPLTAMETWVTWVKSKVKQLLGRPLRGYDDNIKRSRFNEMLRNEFGKNEPFFDLAAVEATSSDGRQLTFAKRGNLFQALVPAYTDDGGHLNEQGRITVAEQFLITLAKLSVTTQIDRR